MARCFYLGCFLCLLGTLTGCGTDSKGKSATVSGTVNLDGQPLDDGAIALFGEGGTGADSLPVKNGKFEGPATTGKKRVEIRAFRLGQPTPMGDEVIPAAPENYLPARFNTESKITVEVTAGGINPNKFDVESK